MDQTTTKPEDEQIAMVKTVIKQQQLSRPLSQLAERINTEHQAACDAALTAIEHGRAAGLLLIEAKSQLGHSEWLPWLAQNCECAPRTAQGYMRLAERWPE